MIEGNKISNSVFSTLSREPRRTKVSWVMLVFALLWTIWVSWISVSNAIIGVPFVILFSLAEVLPRDKTKMATTFRVIAMIYMCLVPFAYVAIFII